ncbi:unnamed protein product [Ectocarpus sp. 4 AP-2014]
MMMDESEERSTRDPKDRATLALPLLSRDNNTWEQFQGANIVADTAHRGEWNDDNSRGLLWRLLLGVIPRHSPPSEWAMEMANKRGEYRRLKAEHRVDISKVLDTTDPMSANPLFSGSGSGDDPWSHFYERKEMTDTIKADLERLFPTGCGDHFLAPARQELLLSVLSVWADLNTETAYRQGMHEVLAPLILALEKEVAAATRAEAIRGDSTAPATAAAVGEEGGAAAAAAAAAKTSPWVGKSIVNGEPLNAGTHPAFAAILGHGTTPEDLEADAFWLFSAVMNGLERFYEHGEKATSTSALGAARGGGEGGGVDSPVVEMCKRLQGARMRAADPELQQHLSHLDISPQLYGMKWARLMFGREFRVEGVLLLWDHIFASSWIEGQPDVPECIENVAVAMVVSIRHQLLAEDCTGCLQLLMRYPPDQGVSTAISLSLSLAKGQSLAAFERSTEPSSFAAASGRAAPSSSSEIQQEPAPVWLNRGGRDHGSVSGRSPSATGSAGHAPSESRRDDGGGGGVGGAGADGRTRAFGRDERLETEREAKNNWQQGLDEFTRRAMSAAQGVAKLAVQTVERTQGGGDPRHLRTAGGVPASEALSLSRRLRTACAKMETGETPVSLAAQEIKEVARILEARSGAPSVREPLRSTNSMGSGGGGQGVTRAFSTYSEDDGCADDLYTQDL